MIKRGKIGQTDDEETKTYLAFKDNASRETAACMVCGGGVGGKGIREDEVKYEG